MLLGRSEASAGCLKTRFDSPEKAERLSDLLEKLLKPWFSWASGVKQGKLVQQRLLIEKASEASGQHSSEEQGYLRSVWNQLRGVE